MSYILDALKRADAERGRGTVPGLNAQPMPGTPPGAMAERRARRGWLAAAFVLVLAGVAAGTWVWRSQAAGDGTPVRVAAVPVPPPAQSQPTVADGLAGSLPATGSRATTPQRRQAPPAVPPTPGSAHRGPGRTGLVPARRTPPMTPPPAVQRGTGCAATARALDPSPRRSSRPRRRAEAQRQRDRPSRQTGVIGLGRQRSPAIAPLLSELPEEIRRLIPALAITGAVYSENPAQRLLLVNGQVLPQGATAAPEVVIEEIRARSATFTFRGSRFRVTY